MIDEDVKSMSPAQLRKEVMRLRRAFRKEADHTGNHRCWVNLMEVVDGKKIKPIDIPQEKFLENCRRYYARNVPGSKSVATFTHEELVAACKNVGVDLTCGACAEIFYTGVTTAGHRCKRVKG